MDSVRRKVTNTTIHVGKIERADDGSVKINPAGCIIVKARRVSREVATRYVYREHRSADYVVTSVDYEEKEYMMSIEKFIRACEEG